MKKVLWMTLMTAMLLLTACSEEDDSAGAGMTIHPIETTFNSADTAEPGEEMTLSVTVVQGEELVEDAEDVVYEVWESGHRDKSKMLTAEHIGDGVYEAETVFETEGLFFVQAHTTARRLHVMPKQELTVGDPDSESIVPDDSDDAAGMEKMEGHDGH